MFFIFQEVLATSLVPYLGLNSFCLPAAYILFFYSSYSSKSSYSAFYVLGIFFFSSFFHMGMWGIYTLAALLVKPLISLSKSAFDFSLGITRILFFLISYFLWLLILNGLLIFKGIPFLQWISFSEIGWSLLITASYVNIVFNVYEKILKKYSYT